MNIKESLTKEYTVAEIATGIWSVCCWISRHLLKLIIYLWDSFTEALIQLLECLNKSHEYDARLAGESEIASRWNSLGFLISSRGRKVPFRKTTEGIFICSPTGSGKTFFVILPALYELLSEKRDLTIIINDPSGQIRRAIAYFAHSKCYNIFDLNFSDDKRSSRYNIFSRAKSKTDLNKIADILVRSVLGSQVSDPFWHLRAKNMLICFFQMATGQKDKTKRNLAGVLELFKEFAAGTFENIDRLVAESDDADLISSYKAILNTPEKVRLSIVETAAACLFALDTPEICRVTSGDDIDFKRLRKGRNVLFIGNSVTDQRFFSALNGVLYEQMYSEYLRSIPRSEENPVYVVLEEASSVFISVLPVVCSNARKHLISTIVVVQNPESLAVFYKDDAKTILTNLGTHIYLPGGHNISLLVELQTLSGRYTYEDEEGNKKVRPNLTMEQIRTMKPGRAIILQGNKPMVLSRIKPAYKHWKYRRLLNLPDLPFNHRPIEP